MQTNEYLISLQNDKQNFTTKLNEKGVTVTGEETFTELIPKIDEIKTGVNIDDLYYSGKPNEGNTGYTTFNAYVKKVPAYKCKATGTSLKNHFSNLYYCTDIDLSLFDTSEATDMSEMFFSLYKIKELDLSSFDTKNVIRFTNMIRYCGELTNLNLSSFDFSKATSFSIYESNNIENLQFGINYGKGFTQASTNYYNLGFTNLKKLTHESLMSIINGLYDLKLTYDVANGGTLYSQTLYLGNDNKSKLTAEEINLVTSKGWIVS